MESWDSETQLLARNRLVISLRLCRTAKAGLGISMENTAFSQPVYGSNVLDSMRRVRTWNIPKNREEATSLRSLMGDKFTEVPARSIECDQLRVPHPTTV